MRLKLLLFSLALSCSFLNAQDTIKTLIISEARMDRADHSYIEFTNVGDDPVNLSNFEFGKVDPWTQPFEPPENSRMMLPDVELQPGESFLIASVLDFTEKMYLIDPDNFTENITKAEMWELADLQIHMPEPKGDERDSVSNSYGVMEVWGRDCWYLKQIRETDSIVIDQVGGVFSEADGTAEATAVDVAGVTDATALTVLVRKFSVKSGNTDFENARGLDLEDSEWMPIPFLFGDAQDTWEVDRAVFWTATNHGDFNLNETTLVSETVDINWQDSILTVPWGVRNDDSLINQFNKQPGIAWHYSYSENHEDSGYVSCRTGDMLTIYTCGNDLDRVDFKIVVTEPTTDANIVIPKRVKNDDGWYGRGAGEPFEVTDGVPGMDSIREVPFGYRADSLFKYLEKAPNANWEMVWKDGVEQTAVRDGDMLKVIAENGEEKEYYIQVDEYRPSHNANLSSITWPDIPEFYKGIFGWMGDTIPDFASGKLDYKVEVPIDVDGIPALIAKSEDLNASLEVKRAVSLDGNTADRTVTFTSTAEDDTTILIYNVVLDKEKNIADKQPWKGEPFISQFVFWEQWNNGFIEFVNPGTEPLDFSKYMIFGQWQHTPADAIASYAEKTEDAWNNRYVKYIPGYKWQDLTNWLTEPAIAVQDLNVKTIIQPGDVFVIADIRTTGEAVNLYGSYDDWPAAKNTDIDFWNNPWGETVNETCARQWKGAEIYLFKILNDSIRQGLKPATDPNDFELIDTWGMGEGIDWVVGGVTSDMINGYVRKPHVYKGTPGFKESFGTNQEDSEWIMTDRAYYQKQNVGWPQEILYVTDGLGSHFMNDVTVGISTVNSVYYKVTKGFSMDEEIIGVVTNTTAEDFIGNIVQKHPEQTLILTNSDLSDTLSGTDVVENGYLLTVLSADESNTTQYTIGVSAEGLSDDATLTSTVYTINVDGETGSVEGFEPGTAVQTVMDNVTVPEGATLTVVDENGAYVSMKKLNFDTTYVDVTASAKVYFEVVAENAINKVSYQLLPNVEASDAFVTSEVYEVDDEKDLIKLLPLGTTAQIFLANLTPATGASIQLIDKLGFVREFGDVYKDDRLVVTAADGETTRTYYLSMLDEQTFLAYVVSDVYTVDQLEGDISGLITGETTLTDFYNNLIPAEGATMVVMNSNNEENTTGDLDMGDYLMVTAGDGVTIEYYTITLDVTSVEDHNSSINIYPNPSAGIVNIAGLDQGTRIQVYNSVGVMLRDRVVHQAQEQISLDDQPAGIYFIVVKDSENIIGRYKLLLK